MNNRQSNKQVFLLEFVNTFASDGSYTKSVKNVTSLLLFSGHSELETGLFNAWRTKKYLSNIYFETTNL